MARKTPQQATDKWTQRVAQSGQYYQQGVQSTTKDWAANTVAAADRRNQALMQAIQNGTIDAGVQRAGTNKWRQNTLNKGVNNWTQNTPRAASKYSQGMQKVYGYFDAADQAVSSMPRTTVQERIARAGMFLQTVHDQAQSAKQRP